MWRKRVLRQPHGIEPVQAVHVGEAVLLQNVQNLGNDVFGVHHGHVLCSKRRSKCGDVLGRNQVVRQRQCQILPNGRWREVPELPRRPRWLHNLRRWYRQYMRGMLRYGVSDP